MQKEQNKKFLSTGLIVFIMTMTANGLSYLFQLLSGRILNPVDYGELNSLFSIINILAIMGNALGLSIVKYTTDMHDTIGGNIKKIFKQCTIISIPIAILITVILISCFDYNIWSSILTSTSIITMCLAFVPYGALQGKKKFMQVSIYNLIQPTFKVLLGIVLLLIGLHFNSVFVVMTCGAIASIVYANHSLKDERKIIKEDSNIIKNIYKYFFFTLVSMVCLTIFNNLDVLLVRNYFSEEMVGQYSSASVFGKIILYIPQALTIMMVPTIAEHKGNEKKTLVKTMGVSIGLSGFAGIVLYLLKRPIILILMGEKYVQAIEYILPICCMMLPLVAVTVLVNYLIAFGDKWFVTISTMIGTIAVLLTANFMHNSINQMVYGIAIVYLILTTILVVRCIMLKQKK